jgi:hypothetical protein
VSADFVRRFKDRGSIEEIIQLKNRGAKMY